MAYLVICILCCLVPRQGKAFVLLCLLLFDKMGKGFPLLQAEQAALIQPKLVNDSSMSGPDLKVLPIVQLTIWETTILGYKSTKFLALLILLLYLH